MAKRVLLTGGTGFVGANLVRQLLADGPRVHLLVRPGFSPWRLEGIRSHVQLHQVTLDDPGLDAVVRRIRPDWVFHLAAHGAYSWQTDVAEIVATNVVGTTHLVRACLRAGFEAFVNTGSSSEYGFKPHAPTERDWLEPNSHYAVTKASATLFCRYTAQRERVHVPTLRLYSVFGPWEDPGRLFPALVVNGLDGGWPPLVSPDTARDFVYVEDVCDAYLRAATVPGQELGAVYNVGRGVQVPLREVVATAQQVMGITVTPEWGTMAGRAWDASVWVADTTAIAAALQWAPQRDLADGLRRTMAWMVRRPARVRRYREGVAAITATDQPRVAGQGRGR